MRVSLVCLLVWTILSSSLTTSRNPTKETATSLTAHGAPKETTQSTIRPDSANRRNESRNREPAFRFLESILALKDDHLITQDSTQPPSNKPEVFGAVARNRKFAFTTAATTSTTELAIISAQNVSDPFQKELIASNYHQAIQLSTALVS